MTQAEDNRLKTILIAAGIFATITLSATLLIIGWHFVPGLLGEFLGVFAGVISTPFFLEASFCLLGLMIVVGLNSWRRHKEGDEFVYLDRVDGPDVPKDLPDHVRWVVYREKPLPAGEISVLEQAEGAVAIGDFEHAAALIATMSHEELAETGVLEVRLALAQASGRPELAARLKREIDERRELT